MSNNFLKSKSIPFRGRLVCSMEHRSKKEQKIILIAVEILPKINCPAVASYSKTGRERSEISAAEKAFGSERPLGIFSTKLKGSNKTPNDPSNK